MKGETLRKEHYKKEASWKVEETFHKSLSLKQELWVLNLHLDGCLMKCSDALSEGLAGQKDSEAVANQKISKKNRARAEKYQ
ncbi:hypothetical protein DSO57_1018906 [Entomophthora muscae]|uniref:Uncharacterized protein n=1 Tax=Entomophthora muscae TaxID=34485 RepID=A0ACC2TR46_9FUNG|nr:hypothetical protein DSO57_1018906 [Entomophthora muscae]